MRLEPVRVRENGRRDEGATNWREEAEKKVKRGLKRSLTHVKTRKFKGKSNVRL